jgi:carboxymethylenebutenolidase
MAETPLIELWHQHLACEFTTRDTEATLATMTDDAYVNHVPVMTGGVGKDQLRDFYARRFIPKMPPDTRLMPISLTCGENQIVDEFLFQFTHTIEMDWMLPGIAPTGKPVQVPFVVIVGFRDGKVAHEHIYWDQASVLVQIGLLDSAVLPVCGVEQAGKMSDPTLPGNQLIERARTG